MTVKYKWLSVLCIGLIINTARAQMPSKLEYGLKASINYTTIGNSYSNYTGSGQYSIGGFLNYNLNPQIFFAIEPTYTSNNFREVQADINYQYNYIDFNLNSYFDIFKSEALWLYAGLKPGYLFNYSTQMLKSGAYERIDTSINKNNTGQIDVSVNAGLSVKLSPMINFEIGYVWSATNNITATRIQGRPSYIEAGLKLNALDLRNVIESKEEQITKQIKIYQKGALYVMLPTVSEKVLQNLRAEDAAYRRTDNIARNKKIMQVFHAQYSFTPVYFFMDTSVSKVISGNPSGIFVNDELRQDTSIIPVSQQNYFVASFCSDLSNINQKISYGLFLYDAKMNQMERPFNIPAQLFGVFTEGDPSNFFGRKQDVNSAPYEKAVKKLNARLTRYAGN